MVQARTRVFQWGNILFFIAMVVYNMASVFGPINGTSMKEVAYKYPHLFIPASWTFSIWSVIYIFLGAFVVYQSASIFPKRQTFLDPDKEDTDIRSVLDMADNNTMSRAARWVNKLDVMFIFTCILNMAWLYAWHHMRYGLSSSIMLLYLISLIVVYVRLHTMPSKIRRQDKWVVMVPFSLYLGWISVATISNIASMFQSYQWDGLGLSQQFWGGFGVLLATLLALFFKFRFNNWAFIAAVAWGLLGISVRQFVDINDGGFGFTAFASGSAAVLLIASIFIKVPAQAIEVPKNTQGRAPQTGQTA